MAKNRERGPIPPINTATLEAVLSSGEIEKEYGLKDGAVRQAIYRGYLPKGSYREMPSGYLVLSSVAQWYWGHLKNGGNSGD